MLSSAAPVTHQDVLDLCSLISQPVNYRPTLRIFISLEKVNLSRQSTKIQKTSLGRGFLLCLWQTTNSQPQHLPPLERKCWRKKKRKKKERNSLLFPLMNGEFPISILITQARLSAGLMITRNSISNKSSWFVNMCWGNAEGTYRGWPVSLFLFWKNPTALIVFKHLFIVLQNFYIVHIVLHFCFVILIVFTILYCIVYSFVL